MLVRIVANYQHLKDPVKLTCLKMLVFIISTLKTPLGIPFT